MFLEPREHTNNNNNIRLQKNMYYSSVPFYVESLRGVVPPLHALHLVYWLMFLEPREHTNNNNILLQTNNIIVAFPSMWSHSGPSTKELSLLQLPRHNEHPL